MTDKEKEEAKQRQLAARREYDRKYREEHREKLKEYKKTWNAANKDKVNASKERYYEKMYQKMQDAEKPDNKVDD